MTCQEIVAVLSDYVAGSLAASVRRGLETHLADCPDCLQYLRGYRETIRLARATALPADDAVAAMPQALVSAILAAAGLTPSIAGVPPSAGP
jgi:anti-sigma factor RsiW